jgi:hypothetical protein
MNFGFHYEAIETMTNLASRGAKMAQREVLACHAFSPFV